MPERLEPPWMTSFRDKYRVLVPSTFKKPSIIEDFFSDFSSNFRFLIPFNILNWWTLFRQTSLDITWVFTWRKNWSFLSGKRTKLYLLSKIYIALDWWLWILAYLSALLLFSLFSRRKEIWYIFRGSYGKLREFRIQKI